MGQYMRTPEIQAVLDDARKVSSYDALSKWAQRLADEISKNEHPCSDKVQKVIRSRVIEASKEKEQKDFWPDGHAQKIVRELVIDYDV